MKKILLAMLLMASFTAVQADDVMRKEKDGTYVVNTTTLAKDVDGYIGPTPVEVYIKKNKVVKVEALKNQETPKYFVKVKKALIEKWNGLKVNEARQLKFDGVTGATFSSDAHVQNVQLGLDYYKSHK
jgi:electron transport complex protein RnfG